MKNSIIAVEAPDEDMADDDYVDDQEEADEVLARHRCPASAPAGVAQLGGHVQPRKLAAAQDMKILKQPSINSNAGAGIAAESTLSVTAIGRVS